MIYRAYRFADQEASTAALAGETPAALDVIGVAWTDADPPVALPGWHVNAAWSDAAPGGLVGYVIDAAEAPRWWAGVPYEAAASEVPVPHTVSLSQLLFALRDQGWITHAEAMAAAKSGDVPATLDGLISSMDGAAADNVRLLWAAMYVAERSNPLWSMIVAGGVATGEQVDNLFRQAASSV